MAGYTKLFNSILDSTIWQESNATRLLWITMLAMSNKSGAVQASVPGLARRAGIELGECERGLLCLESPDPYSRTPDHEGRRIRCVDGGWELLNHAKYRDLLSLEERREYNKKKQAEWRAKHPKNVNDTSMTVNHNKQCQHITDSRYQIADTKEEKNMPPSSAINQSLNLEIPEAPKPLNPVWIRMAKLISPGTKRKFHPDETKWLKLLDQPTEDEFLIMEKFYFSELSQADAQNYKFNRRTSLATLSRHWDGELAKAYEYDRTHP
jgi:hypothetical protein